MELRILGCSGGIGVGLRTTSILLNETTLIDAGTGIGDLSNAELLKIEHIFLTHSHLDHIVGLPLLVDTIFGKKDSPLVVHALPETLDILKKHIFNWQVWPDFTELPSADKPSLHFEPMQIGEEITVEGNRLRMLRANHTVPAAGYMVSNGNATVAFTGDTYINDDLWGILNAQSNLQLLIIECGFTNEEQHLSDVAKHYCPEYLATDLEKLEHECQIAITHLKPGDEERTIEQCKSAMPNRTITQLRAGDHFSY